MMRSAGRPTRSLARRALLVAMVAVLVGLVSPAAARQSDRDQVGAVQVNRLNATSATAELTVIADHYRFGAADVTVVEDGEPVTVTGVQRASAGGPELDIVYVIDTSLRTLEGDVLSSTKAAIINSLRDLPAGTRVGLVEAGGTATTALTLTTDRDAAVAAVEKLTTATSSRLYNAIDVAAAMFPRDAGRLGSIVVFSAGPDQGSSVTIPQIQSQIVDAEVQLISVRYQGGAQSLNAVAAISGGLTVGTSAHAEIGEVMAGALTAASDRMIIRYETSSTVGRLTATTISIGDASASFSHPGGVNQNKPHKLPAVVIPEPSGIAFFRSSLGLYVALGLAFAGIGLAVYALGVLFAGGQSSLEGLISRYSGDQLGEELKADEHALVQTALVRRAVEISESFAEERGFLVKVEDLLERAKVPLRPGEAMSFWLVIALVSGALGLLLTGSFIGAAIFLVVGAFLQISVVRFMARRRIRKFEQQLPDTLQLLAGTLRAGYSLPQGLEAVSHEIADPMGFELRRVMTEARLGRELEEALAAAAERLSSADFAWAVMAIAIQREVGGNLNELLLTVSDTMIARERLKGEVAALTAEGKMSSILLGGLPPALGVIMWTMNPSYIEMLFTETLGRVFLGAAAILMVIGMAWMKKVMVINV